MPRPHDDSADGHSDIKSDQDAALRPDAVRAAEAEARRAAEQQEEEEKRRSAGRGAGDGGNPAHAELGANIRPDVVEAPGGLVTITTQKSATYHLERGDAPDPAITNGGMAPPPEPGPEPVDSGPLPQGPEQPDSATADRPLTLALIEQNPWNAVELPLPRDASPSLLQAALSAADYSRDINATLESAARESGAPQPVIESYADKSGQAEDRAIALAGLIEYDKALETLQRYDPSALILPAVAEQDRLLAASGSLPAPMPIADAVHTVLPSNLGIKPHAKFADLLELVGTREDEIDRVNRLSPQPNVEHDETPAPETMAALSNRAEHLADAAIFVSYPARGKEFLTRLNDRIESQPGGPVYLNDNEFTPTENLQSTASTPEPASAFEEARDEDPDRAEYIVANPHFLADYERGNEFLDRLQERVESQPGYKPDQHSTPLDHLHGDILRSNDEPHTEPRVAAIGADLREGNGFTQWPETQELIGDLVLAARGYDSTHADEREPEADHGVQGRTLDQSYVSDQGQAPTSYVAMPRHTDIDPAPDYASLLQARLAAAGISAEAPTPERAAELSESDEPSYQDLLLARINNSRGNDESTKRQDEERLARNGEAVPGAPSSPQADYMSMLTTRIAEGKAAEAERDGGESLQRHGEPARQPAGAGRDIF